MLCDRMLPWACLICVSMIGATWGDSQWRGPNRDGRYPETGLLQSWPEGGPRVLWSTEGVGAGWGAVSAGPTGRFVVGTFEKKDCLLSLDDKGKILWKQPYGDNFKKSYPLSRCTPTVVDGWVYVTSGSGQVACLNAKTGKERWSRAALDLFEGKTGDWGIVESPLLIDDKVIFTPCGDRTTVVALDKVSGQTLWQSPSLKDKSAYVSPLLIQHGGKTVIVAVTAEYVVGVDSRNGAILWQYNYFQLPHREDERMPYINAVTPLYRKGRLFVTSGYDHCAVLLEIAPDNSGVKEVWQQRIFDAHHGGVVLVDGFIYGSNWESNTQGRWMCVDWQTGEIRYEHEWETKGSMIFAHDRLYCYEEKNGHVALVKPNPEKFEIVSTFEVTQGEKQHWAHPSIYEKVLYIRHGSAVMAYSIGAHTP